MPAAVIMEENFDKLLEQCEAQELEVSAEQEDLASLVLLLRSFRFCSALRLWRVHTSV